jgi:phosphohistidine phosphatase
MRLFFLRHAKAEKAVPGSADRPRMLTKRGHNDAAAVGAYMAHHALLPERVLVSTAQRTRETWERLASSFSSSPSVMYEDDLYNAGADRILALIRSSGSGSLLVIGHNPGIHEAARLLIASGDVAARERLNEGLPTAGLVVIDFAGDDWRMLAPHKGRLEHFIVPRSLRAAAD